MKGGFFAWSKAVSLHSMHDLQGDFGMLWGKAGRIGGLRDFTLPQRPNPLHEVNSSNATQTGAHLMPDNPIDRFLTGPEVDRRYSRSAMTRWRWSKDATLGFPVPMKINGRLLYRLSELEAWERRMAAMSGAAA
jgi:predicted DNA-binding transcriptional regulator AlpA